MLRRCATALLSITALPVVAAAAPRLSSVFVQLASPRARLLHAAGWVDELHTMAKIGVRSIITKFSAASSRHYPVAMGVRAYYPSKLPWVTEEDPGHDSIDLLLRAADAMNFTVHLGHFQDMAWFNHSNHNPSYLAALASRAVAMSSELHARYGSHPSFVGLYDPNEPKGSDWPGEEAEWVVDAYFTPVWGWGRSNGYATSTAPFWHNRTAPGDDATWWDKALTRLPPGSLSVAWLDDDQATNFWTVSGPIPFYAAWSAMAKPHNVSVWSDCVDHNHTDQPQPIGHFVAQLKAEAPYVEGFTTFEWFYYFAPASGAAQKTLYDGYLAYLGGAPAAPEHELGSAAGATAVAGGA
jgi:hypothetical protein